MNYRRMAVVISAIVLIAGVLCHRALPSATPSTGGAGMVMTNITVEPFFLQTDAQWGDDTIGGSEETLSAVGCTVCCLSMAATEFGIPLNPGQLNARLKEAGGYTERGWLMWDVASGILGETVDIVVPRRPSHRRMDEALQKGDRIIAKVLLWGSVPHWVLVVGKDDAEYLVKNPLSQERGLQRLSDLSNTIEAIRIVRR